MRVSKYLFVTLTASFIISGCQETGDDENTDESAAGSSDDTQSTEVTQEQTQEQPEEAPDNSVEELQQTDDEALNRMIDKSEEIESYESTVVLQSSVDGGSRSELDADIKFRKGSENNEPQFHLASEGEDRTISKDGRTFYNNGSDWVDISESASIEQLHLVKYQNVVSTFADIKDELETEENGTTTVYTYEGNSQEVLQTFQELFAVQFGTIDTSNVENSVEIEVDSDMNLIQSIDYEATGKDAEGEYELSGDVEFTSFDSVEEIELPESVR
ncbi:hypothetical protein [Salinicoccus albus]|uniref:hypothetical protein n=1 Tax=Salinicoccus albus TaxID=418756 RepID=UPI00037BACFC|nr:hypothetical protein [Salinicoccus albus]